LLKAARRIGCETVDGGHMNVGQAFRSFKLFTGREPNAARMDERLTESTGGQLLYQFRRPWRDGSTARLLDPLELL
jgi:hypothetical protein